MQAKLNNDMFFVNCMVTFLERTRPASSIVKPAAIQKTKNPPIKNNRLFSTKVISSLYEETLKGDLSSKLIDKIKFDGIDDDNLNILKSTNLKSLQKTASQFSDGIVLEENYSCKEIKDFSEKNCIATLNPDEEDKDTYYHFYQNFFSEALV